MECFAEATRKSVSQENHKRLWFHDRASMYVFVDNEPKQGARLWLKGQRFNQSLAIIDRTTPNENENEIEIEIKGSVQSRKRLDSALWQNKRLKAQEKSGLSET